MLRFLAVTMIASLSDTARILGYFPTPIHSHQVTFRALTQELLKRGHEVTIVTPKPAFPKGQAPKNLTEIDVYDIPTENWRTIFMTIATGKSNEIFDQVWTALSLFLKVHEKQLLNEEVIDIIANKNDTFDLLLLELYFRPAWVLTHVIKAPTIFVSSMGGSYQVYDMIGAPNHPLLYPHSFRQKLYNLSFWEKVVEVYNHYRVRIIYDSFIEPENELNRKFFGPDTPSVTELMKNMEMLFLNVHPIWEGNRPTPPNVVFLGGIHRAPKKELPKKLKMYLDSSKNGVIYISFDTNVMPSILPPEKIQLLVNVFSKLSYDVLWKYDKDELPGRSENIRIEKWLPQSDLLSHPKVKLFITHGGLQSTDEAITAGVPLIGVPILGDQWCNVENYALHKIGIRVDIETMTEETFMHAINTVMGDDSYRNNIIRLRELINDQPQRPLDRAVWWTEHVIRHKGAKHLKSSATNLTWAQYYELELISIVILTLLFFILLIVIAVYFMWKYVSRKLSVFKIKSS